MFIHLLLSYSALADDEMYAYGVDEHTACSSNPDLTYAIDQADEITSVFDDWIFWGYWAYTEKWTDAQVDIEDWTDPTQYSAWGADDTTTFGADAADVVYLSTHGLSHCDLDNNRFWSRVVMGEDNQSHGCRSYTNSNQNTTTREMEWGNTGGDAEALIFDACQTVQKCVWSHNGYASIDGSEFLIVNGYHGDSFDRYDQIAALGAYVYWSRTSGIGDNWHDERVVWDSDPDQDQCPTTIVYGSSSTVRDDFFNNGGLDDLASTGTHSGTTYYGLSGCDPDPGSPL